MDNAPAPDSVPLPVARRETFARLVVAGRNQSDAYREAYPNARAWKDSTVRVKASQLANRPEVSARILALKREAASEAVATAREVQEVLTRQLREADKCGDWRAAVASGKLLADVCGFNAPIREERTVKTDAAPVGASRALGSKESEAEATIGLFLMRPELDEVRGTKDALGRWILLPGIEQAREAWREVTAFLERVCPSPPMQKLDPAIAEERLRALEDAGAVVGEVEA